MSGFDELGGYLKLRKRLGSQRDEVGWFLQEMETEQGKLRQNFHASHAKI